MKISALVLGVLTRIPGFNRLRYRLKGGGSTYSAEYCYSVWLRHLVLSRKAGVTHLPNIVAELGPGESIGVGLGALICGAEHYYALDVINYEDVSKNLDVFDSLVSMFRMRMDIPGEDIFPEIKPTLEDYSFPSEILTTNYLHETLASDRVERIRRSIVDCTSESSMITYQVPWFDPAVIQLGSVDMIFSQAVLEHVEDLENTYNAMHHWLVSGGVSSHQIDFKCHGTASEWNGHWRYSNRIWSFIKGGRPYLINRKPCSVHTELLAQSGMKLVNEKRSKQASLVARKQLALEFRDIANEDLVTDGVYLLYVKR